MPTRPASHSATHCHTGDHSARAVDPLLSEPAAIERAARLFRAIGDESRMRLLSHLAGGACCVTELAAASGDSLSVVSQRLRVLRAEHLLTRRRDGRHITYALADGHVIDIVRSALAHVVEGQWRPSPPARPAAAPPRK